MKTFISIVFAGVALFWVSCTNQPTTNPIQSDFIEISKAQFDAAQMELGQIMLRKFNQTIRANGVVTSLPSNSAVVSMPISCSIIDVNCMVGQMVSKGQILFTVGGHALIELQENYAQSAAQLMRLKAEYDRALVLYSDNISTAKELMIAESAYKTQLASFSSFKLKIASLGLDAASIENGTFVTKIQVVAPIRGAISKVNVSIGQFLEPHVFLADIVNREALVVKLAVFEKDLQYLALGQPVSLKFMGGSKLFQAKLIVINHSVDPESRVVDCYAGLLNPSQQMLVNNQFVEAQITIDSMSAPALPVEAMLKEDTLYYMYSLAKKTADTYFFTKTPVSVGRVQQGIAELLGKPTEGEVLLKGAYSISVD
jgi:cobalt-zinc-cadmium efflux system membrane fusion protein